MFPAPEDQRQDRRSRSDRPRERELPPEDLDQDELDDDMEPPFVPVRRLLSLFIAGFSAMLGVGLIFGAQTSGPNARTSYAVVIFGVQVLFLLSWTMAMRPPGMKVVAAAGLLTAIAADIAAVYPDVAGLGPLALAAVVGFVAAFVGQMVTGAVRMRVTESLGATLLVVIGVVSFSTLIVLTRIPKGTQAIVVCLTATGVALLVARLMDTVAPVPRIAAQVPRGSLGVVVGACAGTIAATIWGSYLVGFGPKEAAFIGLAAAGAGVLADLAVGFAEAGRELAGDAPTMWLARHMQGPLGGFALAAPVAYAVSAIFLT
ncbi:hypothetical protein HDA40_004227 [Hamadaea flava]|uniref:CDP-diglyceride synthetase n=1 Tax=Hamadaea flava TaxID=1742688 RepID=A0ABV8LK00_9ACTN|nr:hypothetical protein [Hamadaea flava]MCP2325720.1 hypothetical protein [Hamadaea flava]